MSSWAELESFTIKGHRIKAPQRGQADEDALFTANSKLRSLHIELHNSRHSPEGHSNRIVPFFTGLPPSLTSLTLDLDATPALPGVLTRLEIVADQLEIVHFVTCYDYRIAHLISRMTRVRKLTVITRVALDLCDASVGPLERLVELVVVHPWDDIWQPISTGDFSALLRNVPALVRLELPEELWDQWDDT